MKRSPPRFFNTPPSPRTPSVTSRPRAEGGQTMPVGWNWIASMSMRSAPAQRARAIPSPVHSQELVVNFQALPSPPVASTMALAPKVTKLPDSLQNPTAPFTTPDGRILQRDFGGHRYALED